MKRNLNQIGDQLNKFASSLDEPVVRKFSYNNSPSNTLVEGLRAAAGNDVTQTTNGAKAYKSTSNSVLDFFSRAPALRNSKENEYLPLFQKAWMQDPGLALKALFWLRDIRGGQGTRSIFRESIKWLASKNDISRQILKKNFPNIVEMGRWDDLLVLLGTPIENDVIIFMFNQLLDDIESMNEGKSVSLCAKWMPSEGASSKEGKWQAKLIRERVGLSPRKYRKILTALRNYLKIVETKMSAGKWKSIDYSAVPSRAMKIYKKAFNKHDQIGFSAFLSKVSKGETKINSGTLYPYDIVKEVLEKRSHLKSTEEKVLSEQWKALPDYIQGNEGVDLVIADTSGSMISPNYIPISSAVGLALYFAERNKGKFANTFITFSGNPTFQEIKGNTFVERVNNLFKADWGSNTNLDAVFDLILNTAFENAVPPSEMPRRIFIVSDMQFDGCVQMSNLESIRSKYRSAGYQIPTIVFWQVNGSNNNSPAKQNDKGVILVAGHSPSTFASLMDSKAKTPMELMLEVLYSPRYSSVTL